MVAGVSRIDGGSFNMTLIGLNGQTCVVARDRESDWKELRFAIRQEFSCGNRQDLHIVDASWAKLEFRGNSKLKNIFVDPCVRRR